MTEARPLTIAIVVGEISGDALGAKLVTAWRRRFPDRHLQFCGTAGPAMQSEGLVSLFPLSDIAVMGIVPVLQRLPLLMRRIRETADAIIAARPDIFIIIDSPDFTHRVAKRVRAALPHCPIVDYVSPTVWAWRPGRAKAMRAYVDHVLALLPFEPAAHARLHGPACTYIGHPLIERLDVLRPSDTERAERRSEPPTVLVLPGSRRSEITRLMPIFGETMALVQARYGQPIRFILPAVDHVRPLIETAMSSWPIKAQIVSGEEEKYRAFRRARAALAASGTVTLELALAHVPMAVGYRVGALEGQIRHIISVPSIVLANLIIGENVIPERIQGACDPDHLASDLLPLMTDTPERRRQERGFERLDQAMAIGETTPSDKAAETIARVLSQQA